MISFIFRRGRLFVVGESKDEWESRKKEGLDSKVKLLLCRTICKAIQSVYA